MLLCHRSNQSIEQKEALTSKHYLKKTTTTATATSWNALYKINDGLETLLCTARFSDFMISIRNAEIRFQTSVIRMQLIVQLKKNLQRLQL